MTTRTFCKLGIAALASTIIPSRTTNVDYQVFLTKNILIKLPDNTYDLNKYGEYVALISQVRVKGKSDYLHDSQIYRFESTPIPEQSVSDKHFRIFIDAIDLYIKQHEGTKPSELCSSTIISV